MQSARLAGAAIPFQPRDPLGEEGNEGIVTTIKSAFLRLKNLYDKVTPVFEEYGASAMLEVS